jgi:hypothetical protein
MLPYIALGVTSNVGGGLADFLFARGMSLMAVSTTVWAC